MLSLLAATSMIGTCAITLPPLATSLSTSQVSAWGGMAASTENISVEPQDGTLMAGIPNQTGVTFSIENTVGAAFTPQIIWEDGDAPTGVETSFESENTLLRVKTSKGTPKGTYHFQIQSNENYSQEATLTVSGVRSSVSLSDDIKINLFLDLNESILQTPGLYAKLTNANGEVVDNYQIKDHFVTDKGYQVTFAVSAKNMVDDVKVELFDGQDAQIGNAISASV